MTGVLLTLAAVAAVLSLQAVGGANALIPELQRQALLRGWASPVEFAALFALAQAAPGPNMLVVTLLGQRAAGVVGALVATLAFVLPSSVLTFVVAGVWERFRTAPWRQRVQAGLTPVTVGLVMAAAVLLCRASAGNLRMLLVIAVSAAALLATKLHPLWLLGLGAALGAAGLLR